MGLLMGAAILGAGEDNKIGFPVRASGLDISPVGSNGAPWSAPWIFSSGGAGTDATMDNGLGRQVTANAAGTFQAARSTYGATNYSNLRYTGRLRFENPRTEQYIQAGWRMSGGTNGWAGVADFPQDGMALSFRPHIDQWALLHVTGGGFNIHAQGAYDFNDGEDVRWECLSIGELTRVSIWPASGSQGAPLFNAVIPGTPLLSGFIGVSTASNLANQEVWWSELRLEVL